MLKQTLLFAIILIVISSCTKETGFTTELSSVLNEELSLKNGMLVFESIEHFESFSNQEIEFSNPAFTSLEETIYNVENKKQSPYYQFNEKYDSYQISVPYLDIAKLLNEEGAVMVDDLILVFTPDKVYSIKNQDFSKIANLVEGKNNYSEEEVFESPIEVKGLQSNTENLKLLEGSCSYNNPYSNNCDDDWDDKYTLLNEVYSYQFGFSSLGGGKKGSSTWFYRLIHRSTYYEYMTPQNQVLQPMQDMYAVWKPELNGGFVRTGSYGTLNGTIQTTGTPVTCNTTTGYCPYVQSVLLDQATIVIPAVNIPQYNVYGAEEAIGVADYCVGLVFYCEVTF